MIQYSSNGLRLPSALMIFDVGTGRVSLKYLSLMKTTYWFSCDVLGSGPRILVRTNSSGSSAGEMERCLICVNLLPVFV